MSLALPEADPSVPPFVPPTELVEAHAKALYGEAYDGLNGLEKYHVRARSFEQLQAIAGDLIGAALDHVTANAAAFGFNEHLTEQIMFARMAGPIAAVVAEGGDVEAESVPETDD